MRDNINEFKKIYYKARKNPFYGNPDVELMFFELNKLYILDYYWYNYYLIFNDINRSTQELFLKKFYNFRKKLYIASDFDVNGNMNIKYVIYLGNYKKIKLIKSEIIKMFKLLGIEIVFSIKSTQFKDISCFKNKILIR